MEETKINMNPKINKKKKNLFPKIKCSHPGCKKKIKKMYAIPCKCKNTYCNLHKSTDVHECAYDHKGEFRKQLIKENQLVEFDKLEKLESAPESPKKIKKEKAKGQKSKMNIRNLMDRFLR
jgi:hypothetical protein